MRVRNHWMFLVFPLAIAACTGPQATTPATTPDGAPAVGASAVPQEDMGTVLATVGDVKVYSKEYEQVAQRKTPANGESLSPEEKKDILQKLIEEKALYQEAKKRGVDNDPKVQKVMINTLLRQEVYSGVRNSDFTQEELQAYFEAHKDEFVVPEKVQIKRIFIRVGPDRADADAKALAQQIYKDVTKDPAKFGDIAAEKSEDPYRRRSGDLGFVGKDGKPGIDASVVDKAFGMNVGDISEPFEGGGGYNIVLVANKRERVERTFEQMRGSVLRKVKNEKYKDLYEKYVADVTGKYAITKDDAALEALKVETPRHMGGPVGGPPMPGMRGPGELDDLSPPSAEGPEGMEPGPGPGEE
jgi:peptidyl-prolyl cis-trans isomerase C